MRISLDTNLTMLTETGRLGNNDRWFRDPSKPVPRNEITRFPHAVLEVKLQLKVRSLWNTLEIKYLLPSPSLFVSHRSQS